MERWSRSSFIILLAAQYNLSTNYPCQMLPSLPMQEICRTPLLALPPSSSPSGPSAPSPALCSCESLPVPLDLSRLSSVRSFAACWAARGLPLHLLVCNAGVMGPPDRRASADGHELQFQVGRGEEGTAVAPASCRLHLTIS